MNFPIEPFQQFNEWPDELAKEVMESTALTWSLSERSDFCAHLAATRVSVNVFEFEMNPTFRTALPAFFFGWWLYMTEVNFRARPPLALARSCTFW